MNYPCGIIKDLLPLYYDGVCSPESSQAVKEHLAHCPQCRASLEALKEGQEPLPPPDEEEKKAASFRSLKKKLRKKQIQIGVICVALAVVCMLLVSTVLKNTVRMVEYKDNIQVTMEKEGLVSQLEGTLWYTCSSVTVETQEGKCLFFGFTNTAWDDLITGDQAYCKYTLCPADKGADQIEKVYYYTGDCADLSRLNQTELAREMENAVLLWTK